MPQSDGNWATVEEVIREETHFVIEGAVDTVLFRTKDVRLKSSNKCRDVQGEGTFTYQMRCHGRRSGCCSRIATAYSAGWLWPNAREELHATLHNNAILVWAPRLLRSIFHSRAKNAKLFDLPLSLYSYLTDRLTRFEGGAHHTHQLYSSNLLWNTWYPNPSLDVINSSHGVDTRAASKFQSNGPELLGRIIFEWTRQVRPGRGWYSTRRS